MIITTNTTLLIKPVFGDVIFFKNLSSQSRLPSPTLCFPSSSAQVSLLLSYTKYTNRKKKHLCLVEENESVNVKDESINFYCPLIVVIILLTF